MKAFITGIAGFVGTHLAEWLLQKGDTVAGCGLKAKWLDDVPATLPAHVELLEWDISHPAPAELHERLAAFDPTCIYHLASLSVPAECGSDEPTSQAVSVNVEGTRNVMQLAARLPSRPRVVFISTSHVYEPVEEVGQRVDENWPSVPRGAYGKTKLAAERVVLEAVHQQSADAVIVRAFQHAGPRQRPELMLSEWCKQIVDGHDPLTILNRDSFIDMSDVRDVVRAYRLLAEHGEAGQIYNVGSGRAVRSGDVFDELCHRFAPDRETRELSPCVRARPIADVRRLQSLVDWRPQLPLAETLNDTFEYWRQRVKGE